jgi:hypothetical protein
MTFLEAALRILRREGQPLHYKELTERALGKKLLTFVGRTPEVTMQTQLTAAVKKAPGNPFVRVKPGVFGLLRYPELSAEEREAEAAEARASQPKPPAERSAGASNGDAARGSAGEGGRRRRRRRGGRSGRGEAETEGRPLRGHELGAGGAAGEEAEAAEPGPSGLSAEARAAALAETGVLEADDDETSGDDNEGSMEDDDSAAAVGTGAEPRDEDAALAEGQGDDEGEGEEGEEEGELEAGAAPGGAPVAGEAGEAAGGRRRRRRRRRGRGGEGESFGEAPRAPEAGPERGHEGGRDEMGAAPGESGEMTGGTAPGEAPPAGGEGASGGAPAGGGDADRQGPRRIMTPVDAALEILRGQAPGRGVHVRQIADAAARRKLVHGEPNEAWRVMRAALAAEPRERLRAGLRPRVRSAGAGLYALARRPPDPELERAEQVFGEARRALRERTLAAVERRIAELPGSAFEALARVLLQREGFGPATFVKRVEGTIYVEALRGRGARPSKCLVGLRFGSASGGRRTIGELRAGIRARGQDEGLLMLAGRLAEDAIGEWKLPGPPIEIADGPAMAETCVRHGVGVINTMVSVDFVDADFFADVAEG